MTRASQTDHSRLPGKFEELVRLMPPRAISDETELGNVIAMVDRLMAAGALTRGQEAYLETLVQLVEAYERAHHAIEPSSATGLAMLKHMLNEHGLNASDLARLLGVHVSMGSKILLGERALTIEHVRTLGRHFAVSPALFV